jgi:hypothetical protein
MLPGHDSKNYVCVGYFLGIHDLTGFTFDAICTIAACFGDGTLIDLVNAGQDDIELMICHTVLVPAVVVFAEVYFFEDISVVEIVHTGC